MKKPLLTKFLLLVLFFILAYFISQVVTKISSSDVSNKVTSPQVDLEIARIYFEKAMLLQTAAKYDSSNLYFEKALSLFSNEKSWIDAINCLCNMGNNFVKKGLYDKAMEQVTRAKQIANSNLRKIHPSLAKIFNTCGKVNRKKGELSQAEKDFQKAIAILSDLNIGQSIEIANSYHGLGVVNYYYGNFDKAMDYHQKALSIRLSKYGEQHPSVADSYINFGIIFSTRGDLDSTLVYYQKALNIRRKTIGEEHPDVSNSYLNLGVLNFQKGDYEKAIKNYEKSVSIVLAAMGSDHPSLAGNYLNLGDIWFHKGNLEKALEYFRKSLSLTLDVIGENHSLVALNYNNIGIIFKHKADYDNALKYYNKALKVHLRLSRQNHPDIIRCYLNIANIFSLKKAFVQALEHYNKALALARQTREGDESLIAIIYNNIGIAYSDQENYSRALHFFSKSLELSQRILGETHPLVSETFHQIAEVYSKKKKFETSLSYLQKAIISLVPEFKDTNIYSNPRLNNINEEKRLLRLLTKKAETFKELFFSNTTNTRNLEASVSTYEYVSNLIDGIRTGYKSESLKLLLGEEVHDIYDRAIQSSWMLYQLNHEEELKEKAFSFVEKIKFSTLYHSIVESKAKKFAGIPDSLLDEERQLKIDLSFLDREIFEETEKVKKADSSKIELWQNKLFSLKRDYEALINHFEQNFPAYFNLKYQTATRTVKEIQEKILKSDSAILEYFISDSLLFIFSITKDRFEINTVPKDEQFSELVEQMRSGLMNRNYIDFTAGAYRLYKYLIEPVKLQFPIRSLIIIPDGILGYIPFETLLSRPSNKNLENYSDLSYLIRNFQISYSYSATVLFENLSTKNFHTSQNYVGFAPVVFN